MSAGRPSSFVSLLPPVRPNSPICSSRWPSDANLRTTWSSIPLLPIQLRRIARRITIGVGRTGTPSGDNSGDIFLAFSTANGEGFGVEGALRAHRYVANDRLDPVFLATVEAVEEAIVNAMLAAETMTGRDGHRVVAIDHDRLREVLGRHGRFAG